MEKIKIVNGSLFSDYVINLIDFKLVDTKFVEVIFNNKKVGRIVIFYDPTTYKELGGTEIAPYYIGMAYVIINNKPINITSLGLTNEVSTDIDEQTKIISDI